MHIVTRDVKEARRLVGSVDSSLKTRAHRTYRRDVNTRLHQLTQDVNHAAGMNEIRIDMQPRAKQMLTKWTVR